MRRNLKGLQPHDGNGKLIAYGKGGSIAIVDAETRRERPLLVGEATMRYTSIYWNLAWSHDSRSVGFKARRRDDNTDEFAVADVDPPQQFKVLVPNAKGGPKVTWLPDNSGVVFMMNNPLVQGNKLYSVNRKNPGPPQLLPDQPRDQIVLDADWSPDGKWIVATIQQVPQPIEWHGEPITPAGQVAH